MYGVVMERPKPRKTVDEVSVLIVLSGLFVAAVSFIFSPSVIGPLGIIVVVASAFKWGLTGGVASALWFVFITNYIYFTLEMTYGNYLAIIIVYVIIGIGLGKAVETLKENREQLEQDTRELKEKSIEYQTIFEGTQCLMFLLEVMDYDSFRLLRSNQAFKKATGISEEQLKDKNLQKLLGKEIYNKIKQRYQECLQLSASISYEETHFLPAGKKNFHTTLTPIFNKQNKVTHIVASALDITYLKQTEDDLARAYEELRIVDRRKSEFLGILAHELRNPLATIIMALPQLDSSEEKQLKKARDIIYRQTSQLSRLVEELLAITRIAQNKIVLQKKKTELNHLINQVIEDYRSKFQEKGVALMFKPAPEDIHLEADPERLFQVVGNLLNNAYKYTEKGGYTEVSITRDPGYQQGSKAVIQVKDSGVGICSEMLPELFEPFTQGNCSNSDLGLGLALVKALTELHHGSVEAHSEGQGKGSTFIVYLPCE